MPDMGRGSRVRRIRGMNKPEGSKQEPARRHWLFVLNNVRAVEWVLSGRKMAFSRYVHAALSSAWYVPHSLADGRPERA